MDFQYIEKAAVFSKDGRHRYELRRVWNSKRKLLLFILFNPSTADASKDDPTLRRIVRFANAWGYGGVLVGNLYSLCSSTPKAIAPLGTYDSKNVLSVEALLQKADAVVYAWGQNHPVPDWLEKRVKRPLVLELSKKGVPKHPLYLSSKTKPQVYTPLGE